MKATWITTAFLALALFTSTATIAQESHKRQTESLRLNTAANSTFHLGTAFGMTGGNGLSARVWYKQFGIQANAGYFGVNNMRQINLGATAMGRVYRGKAANILLFVSHSGSQFLDKERADSFFIRQKVMHGTGAGVGFEFAPRSNAGVSLLVGMGESSIYRSHQLNAIFELGIHRRF
ncbi:MAG: hypothetical protein KDC12_04570 [Flavobacteriales bacterium]|nr:hypothetical protein [Flavobacteriales bacterium]